MKWSQRKKQVNVWLQISSVDIRVYYCSYLMFCVQAWASRGCCDSSGQTFTDSQHSASSFSSSVLSSNEEKRSDDTQRLMILLCFSTFSHFLFFLSNKTDVWVLNLRLWSQTAAGVFTQRILKSKETVTLSLKLKARMHWSWKLTCIKALCVHSQSFTTKGAFQMSVSVFGAFTWDVRDRKNSNKRALRPKTAHLLSLISVCRLYISHYNLLCAELCSI